MFDFRLFWNTLYIIRTSVLLERIREIYGKHYFDNVISQIQMECMQFSSLERKESVTKTRPVEPRRKNLKMARSHTTSNF
jgi:hypothetical protein